MTVCVVVCCVASLLGVAPWRGRLVKGHPDVFQVTARLQWMAVTRSPLFANPNGGPRRKESVHEWHEKYSTISLGMAIAGSVG